MPLKPKLNEDDLALLEIIEDPIWFGEFLRSTSDGETNKSLHPAQKWKYRDYQKQFLSDQSEFILYTGGRSIGKCQPHGSRVYTLDGYRTVADLAKERAFSIYTLTPDMQVEQRRAVCMFDKQAPTLLITTESGYKVTVTKEHPILTPSGYKTAESLSTGDYAAVTTKLPHLSNQNILRWYELRLFGYMILQPLFGKYLRIAPRYRKIGAEIELISDEMFIAWNKDRATNEYSFLSGKYPARYEHPITILLDELGVTRPVWLKGIVHIPKMIMRERLENIQVFLEAVFAQFGELSTTEISLILPVLKLAEDFQELLLRFGVETRISENNGKYILSSLNYRAVYRFWNTFTIPGISTSQLRLPPETEDATEFMRYDRIISILPKDERTDVFAIYVYETNNYISENIFVHNTVVLEDKIVYDIINQDMQFPVTKESVLVTPNQAQMTPLLNKIVTRFTSSRFLKDFLKNRVNKSEGTMQFTLSGKPMIFNFRIAGSRGESNMVGLHIPRILADETQLFPINSWTQLQPALNAWEPNTQIVVAGVHNGLRNSVLYTIDYKTPKYKKYRIPAHMNPVYTFENDQDNVRKYGGEQDDRYQQLVLGRPGSAAFQVIPRESITVETFPFYTYRYNSGQIKKGKHFKDVLEAPVIQADVQTFVLAIDPGFVDPCVIQVIGKDKKGTWRTYVRYRLTRIDYNEQQDIIDWVATVYRAPIIAIDIGAGGNGSAMMHNMINGPTYAGKKYMQRFMGIQFSENIIAGYDEEGEELVQDSKSYAANELAKIIQEGRLVFSELDHEGLSQIERIAKQKMMSGKDKYFVLSDRGAGADEDDHIFAAYICFVLAIRDEVTNPTIRVLARPHVLYQDSVL